VLNDKDCNHYYYTFRNFTNCDIVAGTTHVNNGKTISFRFKDKY